MSQKTFSKHSEYRTYSTKGSYDGDGDFETIKTELLPSKYGSLVQAGNGVPPGNKEYYYEYKEEKNPAGTYDRKDLRTVEQYEFSHGGTGANRSFHSTPKRGELTQNIQELDSLLDDLQKDQERKPYKSGYSSDTMESSSFDYKTSVTPVKSSGYSSLSTMERDLGWIPPAQPSTLTREVNREVIRNQVTESHLVPVAPQTVPSVVCDKCVPPSQVPMNKVTTTVKTYTYEVPANQDPTLVPIPGSDSPATSTSVKEKYLTADRSYVKENQEHRTYVNTQFNTSTPVGSPVRQPSPLPCNHYREVTTVGTTTPAPLCIHCHPQPVHVCPHQCTSETHVCSHQNTNISSQTLPGCNHVCPQCSQKITTTSLVQSYPDGPNTHSHGPPYPGHDTTKVTTRTTHYTTAVDGRYPDNKSPYPGSGNPPYSGSGNPPYPPPLEQIPKQPNQGTPSTTVYKYTTTNYTYNPDNRSPGTGPFPVDHLGPRASPFPRTESPAPRTQEPPKRLDELLADFPGHENYPPDNDGLRKRPNPARGPGGAINGQLAVQEKVSVQNQASKAQEQKALTPSRNIAGPAVYYPPGHEMFTRKDQSAAYQQAGGGQMKASGKYKYEAESSSKSKSSSGAAVVPVCLPLCCAMPCVLL